MEAIAWKYLRQLQERSAALGTQLQLPQEAASFLLEKSPGKDGARQLRRLVQSEVEGPLASFLLNRESDCQAICAGLDGEKLCFHSE